MPRRTFAVAVLVLATLAGTLTYTGFLVVGVLADRLDVGRGMAGLLLGGLLARFPWVSQGRLRIVGVVPKPARRPLIIVLLALCLLHFVLRGEYGHAAFPGFAMLFILLSPWLRRSVLDRILSPFVGFAGRKPRGKADEMVIDGDFRERKP